jgi:NADP-dependent 3-hydroxy acid dehydrogenase YdfG
MKLDGQVALITGASRGLGLAIARALGGEGARIAALARAGDELDRAVASLEEAGVEALAAPADVTVETEVANAVRATLDRWRRIDVAILNAGTWRAAPLHETTEETWDFLVDLNLKGAFLTLKHVLPVMYESRRGTVVGISSLGGLVGQPGSAVYAASKWGLRGLLESAALEARRHRVRVSLVHPHQMNTAGRAIAPEERDQNLDPENVASLIAWICAAPEHVSVGNVTIWPLATGVKAV